MPDNNLDFLDKFKEGSKCEKIRILKSNFEDNVWIFSFETKKVIDFSILLQDGSSLTDKKNTKTLYTLKTLIIEFFLNNDMHLNAENTIKMGLSSLLHFVGLINTHDEDQSFAKHGFKAIDKDKLMMVFRARLENNDLFYAYKGDEKLNLFLKENGLAKSQYKEKDIGEIKKFLDDNNIDLQNKIFKHRTTPVKISLSNILLNEENDSLYLREYQGVFRKTDTENTKTTINSLQKFMTVISILKRMHQIKDKKISLPFKKDLDYILNYDFNYKESKHFETYPIQTIFKVFKDALEFHFKYGHDIVNSYLSFLDLLEEKTGNKDGSKKPIAEMSEQDIDEMAKKSIQGNLNSKEVKKFLLEEKENYFEALRNNNSLHSLLKIYYGCVQFIVGALMARRQSEINSMEINCFDEEHLQISFRKSKSYQHSFGIRDYISLPAPEIVIEMLKNINRVAERLGAEKDDNKLFFSPRAYNPLFPIKCKKSIYGNLDNMFDYFEVDLIEGKRPYVRQHQLRRFFAMAFFWSKGFKSIDTLRWFLGHTDAEHVYNYIKENTQGEILNSVKAQYISENIDECKDFKEFFERNYGIENYNLIEKDDLAEYINSMLEDNLIEIEPEFIEDDEGQEFEIIVKVKNYE